MELIIGNKIDIVSSYYSTTKNTNNVIPPSMLLCLRINNEM